MKNLKISIIVDNVNSWMTNHAKKFSARLKKEGHRAEFVQTHEKIRNGDVAVFLSCEKIVKPEILKRNGHNLVVHESDLPQGKGWSPTTWQVLEGKKKIPICLFEAANKVDAGPIYYKSFVKLDGSELVDEIREKQAEQTFFLVEKFISDYPNVRGKPQKGKESFYGKRTPQDSELDINKPIKDQFNLLRVVDNERYPAFFMHGGKKYIIKIVRGEG